MMPAYVSRKDQACLLHKITIENQEIGNENIGLFQEERNELRRNAKVAIERTRAGAKTKTREISRIESRKSQHATRYISRMIKKPIAYRVEASRSEMD